MDLEIKDVADLLNLSETTIRRWAIDGKIPAYKMDHQYRFSRLEIEKWMMEQNFGGTEDADRSEKKDSGRKQFGLYRAINSGGVFHDIPGKTKEQILRAAIKRIAPALSLDVDVITELMLDREALQPTALNHGIAVPHTRECLLDEGKNVVVVVFPEQPIEYGALDGRPVHTLFFLFASGDKHHLQLLAKIAHLSNQGDALEFFRKKPPQNVLLAYIKQWESGF